MLIASTGCWEWVEACPLGTSARDFSSRIFSRQLVSGSWLDVLAQHMPHALIFCLFLPSSPVWNPSRAFLIIAMKGNPQPCANTISAAIQGRMWGARIHPASERRFQLLTAIGKGEMFNTWCERRQFLIQNRYWAHRCHHLHAHLAVWFPWWVSYFQISSLPSPLPFSCPQLLSPAPATTVTLNCAPNVSPGSTEWKN